MEYRIKGRDTKCKRCSLSTGCSIFGQSGVPINKVLMVVISAYPGKEEIKQGISLAPQEGKVINAGKFFRMSIEASFDKDERIKFKPFTNYIYITNMIKCTPNEDGVKTEHIEKCKDWLDIELEEIPNNVPILLASNEAVKGVLGPDYKLHSSRRQVHYFNNHPVVVTFNPIEPLRYSMGDQNGGKFWKPIPVGELRWHYMKDLQLIKELVIQYINNN